MDDSPNSLSVNSINRRNRGLALSGLRAAANVADIFLRQFVMAALFAKTDWWGEVSALFSHVSQIVRISALRKMEWINTGSHIAGMHDKQVSIDSAMPELVGQSVSEPSLIVQMDSPISMALIGLRPKNTFFGASLDFAQEFQEQFQVTARAKYGRRFTGHVSSFLTDVSRAWGVSAPQAHFILAGLYD